MAASMMQSAIFVNSDGVNWNPANWNHRWAPRVVVPTPGMRTKISIVSAAA